MIPVTPAPTIEPVDDPPFSTVLVANRGEIARRVIRTLRRLGIRSVAVYSDADAHAPHVREADIAVRIGPAAASASYLDIAAVIAAARETGAEAIHPGYGFLSENAGFARACADAGIVFIGPGERALDVMGDKIRAKEHVSAHDVPTVPGFSAVRDDGTAMTDADIAAAADDTGYPLLVKPSAGGGGKGMQVVRAASELPEALATARRVAAAAFGDDTLLLERLIERPRHIEVQVLADAHGTVIHLGERECTLQRRHQKVIEEAPSPVVDAATRARLGAAACAAAASVDYRGAGTVEFLVAGDRPDEFFFIEMNTRLQVEHPVTELVTGVDLVEQQLLVAAGRPLALAQDDIRLDGHAIEARVYAESPERGFLPATGDVLVWREPARGADGCRGPVGQRGVVRLRPDDRKGHRPRAAIAPQAIERLDAALAETVLLGVDSNLGFLRALLADPGVRAGDMDTGLIDRLPPYTAPKPGEAALAAAAAGRRARACARRGAGPIGGRRAVARRHRLARGKRTGRPHGRDRGGGRSRRRRLGPRPRPGVVLRHGSAASERVAGARRRRRRAPAAVARRLDGARRRPRRDGGDRSRRVDLGARRRRDTPASPPHPPGGDGEAPRRTPARCRRHRSRAARSDAGRGRRAPRRRRRDPSRSATAS